MSAGASCPPDPARPDPVVRSRRHWLAAAPLGLTALALQPSPLWAATAAPALGDPVLWPGFTVDYWRRTRRVDFDDYTATH